MSRWTDLLTLADRSCLATFGIPVIYIPSVETRMELGGIPICLSGVFDEKREVVSLMGGGGIEAAILQPTVEIRLADLGIKPMAGDAMQINEQTYQIIEVQFSGKGMALLVLDQLKDPLGF